MSAFATAHVEIASRIVLFGCALQLHRFSYGVMDDIDGCACINNTDRRRNLHDTRPWAPSAMKRSI